MDYGCGKGRVDFFISYQTRCKSIGVEYDERIYTDAIDNMECAISKSRVYFHMGNAEEFEVPLAVDRCYFFNPFSAKITVLPVWATWLPSTVSVTTLDNS